MSLDLRPDTRALPSPALRLLGAGGTVRSRRDGRMVCYFLDDAHVRILLDLACVHLRHAGL